MKAIPLMLAVTLGATASDARGAPLTLGEALQRAARQSYGARARAAEADARAAEARRPLQGILPGIRVEAGYVRTTLPLNAFGILLQQRQVTQEAFAPARLNGPEAIGNWSGGVVAEVPLLNLDAWAARSAASDAADAARASLTWTREDAQVGVIAGYFGAILAREQVRTLAEGLEVARAHVAQAQALERSGVVTGADALLASVKAGEIQVRLIEAERGAAFALEGLAVALGTPEEPVELTAELPDAAAVSRLASALGADARGDRADVLASEASVKAAEGDARRARALFLPRLNALGRLDWNSADAPFAGRSAWTVGVMATWSLFSGGGDLANAQAASARASAARAMAEATRAKALLDVRQSGDALAVALERLTVSEGAVSQSSEAHRIVAKRYDGGLANVTELLDAAAQETLSRLGYADARFRVIVASAERRHAAGLDLAIIAEHLELR